MAPMLTKLAEPADLDYSAAEVKQLWWFRDGAIMSVPIRDRLWDARGLCHRHAWGYAVLEIELLAGQAFSTAVLYADLTDRAAKLVGKRGMRKPKLNADGFCMTCDHIKTTASQPLTGAEWPRGAVRVNARGDRARARHRDRVGVAARVLPRLRPRRLRPDLPAAPRRRAARAGRPGGHSRRTSRRGWTRSSAR